MGITLEEEGITFRPCVPSVWSERKVLKNFKYRKAVLDITVQGRGGKYSLCVDTQRVILNDNVTLHITKEQFTIQTVLFDNANFYATIREKLLWGLDKRND